MAIYTYVGQHYITVTATARSHYRNLDEFVQTVDAWLVEHNIPFLWEGHNTSNINNGPNRYTYFFRCINEEDAVFAALRWA